MLACTMAGNMLKPYLLVPPPKKQEGQGTIILPAEPANLMGNIVVNSTANGYMTGGMFERWLKLLRAELQHKDKVILLVDGHKSPARRQWPRS